MKKEWAKLRENFRKTLIKREKATRSGAGSKKPLPSCNYFVELSFLTDSMSNRPSTTNVPPRLPSPIGSPASTICGEDVADDIQQHIETNITPVSTNITPVSKRSDVTTRSSDYSNPRKRRSVDADENANLLLVQTLDKHLNQPEQAQVQLQEEDDDRLFCLSLVKTLKGMAPKKNALSRIKVQQVLFDVQFQD